MTDTPDDQRPETTDPAAPMPDPAAGPGPDDGATAGATTGATAGATTGATTGATPGAAAGVAAGAADAQPDAAAQAKSAAPDPFPPVVTRIRTRWINPRRRWAVALIAAGAAIVVFAGGVATGFGIGHGDRPGVGGFHSWLDHDDMPGHERMPWPGMWQRGPGMQQFPGYGQRRTPGGPGQGSSPNSPSPSPSSAPAPSSSAAPAPGTG